eukprot:TRINITY_DN1470_c0_g1_i2.p1 TRINITY_DN1470_c0_g1~~TRINITY_DN1470_c0_g1_i2.p1  ORF type:complete len:1668 (+),score=456.60 TRINITY_DN1470_c0_g1_i2:65-5005(+)
MAASVPPPGGLVFFLPQQSDKLSWTTGVVAPGAAPPPVRGVQHVKVKEADVTAKGEVREMAKEHTVPIADVQLISDPGALSEAPGDLLRMTELQEGMLLRSVRDRYRRDVVATNIGPSVCLSVNPFKWTLRPDGAQWENARMMPRYVSGEPGLAPHVWVIGRQAYTAMADGSRNQTILVSGESGAGKTEAVKMVLSFLGNVAEHHSGGAGSDVQSMIMACNPVLETFGNAKTVRNDNSSRFGKFLQVQFDRAGAVAGAKTVNYLLEGSRVVTCGRGERVYHSFYQLLAGAPEKYGLEAAGKYPNVSKGGCLSIDGVDDASDFRVTCEAMEKIGMTEVERDGVWRTLAGILHMQRVEFVELSAGSAVAEATKPALVSAAKMWGVDVDAMVGELVQTTLSVGTKKGNPPGVAAAIRDSLCKHLYNGMFDWLVNRMNEGMDAGGNTSSWIGLLDIFGFEHFEKNSLEQLCINLANEMLQNHYNSYIFEADMEECRQEGIDVTAVDFKDNACTVELISQAKQGIMALIDDQCRTFPERDDQLLAAIKDKHSGHPSFPHNPRDRNEFRVRHYAAEVRYDVEGFGVKNQGKLNSGLVEVMRGSADPLVAEFIPPADSKGTVTLTFRSQLEQLLVLINETQPSWIRCIKSCQEKKPDIFGDKVVMSQLRSSGVLETVRIRKAGYPVRIPHAQFFARYSILSPPGHRRGDYRADAVAIIEAQGLGTDLAQVGRTKVFLRAHVHPQIEAARNKAYDRHARMVQRFARSVWPTLDAMNRRYGGLIEKLKEQARERQACEAGHMTVHDGTAKEEAVAWDALMGDFAVGAERARALTEGREAAERLAVAQRASVEKDEDGARGMLEEDEEHTLAALVEASRAAAVQALERAEEAAADAIRREEDETCELELWAELQLIQRAMVAEAVGQVERVHDALRDVISHEEVSCREALEATAESSRLQAELAEFMRARIALADTEEVARDGVSACERAAQYRLESAYGVLLQAKAMEVRKGMWTEQMVSREPIEQLEADAFERILRLAVVEHINARRRAELSLHGQTRGALQALEEEAWSLLQWNLLKAQGSAAAQQRRREISTVLQKLDEADVISAQIAADALNRRICSASPPPRDHDLGVGSPPHRYQSTPPPSHLTLPPQATAAAPHDQPPVRSASAESAGAADPFLEGSWLWRMVVPCVGDQWVRVWAKVDGAELLWWPAGGAPQPRRLDLRNGVVAVESHSFPDQEGHLAPLEHFRGGSGAALGPAARHRCRHSATRIVLTENVRGSAARRWRAVLLYAERPVDAAVLLRRIRRVAQCDACERVASPSPARGFAYPPQLGRSGTRSPSASPRPRVSVSRSDAGSCAGSTRGASPRGAPGLSTRDPYLRSRSAQQPPPGPGSAGSRTPRRIGRLDAPPPYVGQRAKSRSAAAPAPPTAAATQTTPGVGALPPGAAAPDLRIDSQPPARHHHSAHLSAPPAPPTASLHEDAVLREMWREEEEAVREEAWRLAPICAALGRAGGDPAGCPVSEASRAVVLTALNRHGEVLKLLARCAVSPPSTAGDYAFDAAFRRLFLSQGPHLIAAREIADWLTATAEAPEIPQHPEAQDTDSPEYARAVRSAHPVYSSPPSYAPDQPRDWSSPYLRAAEARPVLDAACLR